MEYSSDEDQCVCCLELASQTHSCNTCACLLCGKCAAMKAIKANCPTCRNPKTIRPNRAMEKRINIGKVACIKGCGLKVKREDLKYHQRKCRFGKTPATKKQTEESTTEADIPTAIMAAM